MRKKQDFSKKRLFAAIVFGFVFLLMSPWGHAAGMEADMVIYNGKILTIDSPDPARFTIAQAIALYDGKIIVVGTNEEALEMAGPGTRKIDLGGRTVIPGLVETHNHIQGYGAHFFPDGRPPGADPPLAWGTYDEGLAQIRTIALQKKPGEWIRTSVRGGLRGEPGTVALALAIKRGEVTRFDMDKVTPDNPLRIGSVLLSPTGDSMVNTKALDLLLARHPDLPGVHRDEQGVATGWLSGVADKTVEYEFYPPTPPEQLGPVYRMEMVEIAAQGLTTVSTRLAPTELTGYAWLRARGELPVRMAYTMESAARSEHPEAVVARMAGIQGGSGKGMWGMGDDKLWTIGLSPISIDSVPSIAGSCISIPYPREAPDFPLWLHQLYGPNGLCRLEDSNYRTADELRAAAKYGFRIAGMHTGGDRGIDQLFDLIEELSQEYPHILDQRWAVDHCRFLTDEHARRAKQFNLFFSCGPKYVYAGKRGDIGAYAVLFGEETAADVVVPTRRLLDHGLRVTMELDQHGFHPFLALEVLITREDMNGVVWGAHQKINRREALYTYTRWSSEYVLKEDVLGTLEPKKAADFVVLSRDYLTVPDDEIGQIDPVLTVMDGNITYTDPDFARAQGLPQVGYRGSRTWWMRGVPEDATRSRVAR